MPNSVLLGVNILFSKTILSLVTVVIVLLIPFSFGSNLCFVGSPACLILGFSIVQIGLSIKSHDPSQRANGFLTLAGGIVITFAKEILNMITGG